MRPSIALLLGTALCLWAAATLGAAEPSTALSLEDLINRPDRWPESVTVPRDFIFGPNAAVHAGTKATVAHFDGSKVLLVAANGIRFTATPSDSGLLEAANQAWAALTPAQRAVGPQTLATDPSLWPVRVKTTTVISGPWGKLPAGTEVGIIKVTATTTDILWPNSSNGLNVPFDCTDVFTKARKLALMERSQRPSRIAAAFAGLLVGADGNPLSADAWADKKVFALYFGAGWCAPCHAFSPNLVVYLEKALPQHPELAAVFLSNDKQVGPMLEYMKEERMPFPAVPPDLLVKSPVLMGYAARMIPQLVIVDRFGTVLASNDDHQGNRGDPKDTIAALDLVLANQAR